MEPPTTWPEQIAFDTWTDDVQSFGILDVGTGELTILSPAKTNCSFGDWSPDGRRMAYECEGSLYVAWGDGTHAELVFEGARMFEIRWSPVGDEIAFYGTRPEPFDFEIWVVPAMGGTARKLTNGADGLQRLRWSPDGDQLAVRTEGEGVFGFVLGTVNAATGAGRVLLTGEAFFHEWLSVAHAGPARGLMAYTTSEGGASPTEIWAMDFEGNGAVQLSGPGGASDYAEWSTSGSMIAWTNLEGSEQSLVVTRADGSDAVVHPISGPGPLTWSPDDTRLAFSSGSSTDARLEIIEIDSGTSTHVTEALLRPRWRPAPAP